jgi:alkanesulfonate monooxygenase SsuD/methylene tetrahydromethanopterin reductase-like flavin-dependent oxidoreductase (luciferase family)
VAERADGWNMSGNLEEVTDAMAALAQHAETVGRDLAAIEKTISFPIILRDRATDAAARMAELCGANGVPNMGELPHLTGSPAEVADGIRPYRDLGFGTVIVRMAAPYDEETIDRFGEVIEALDR